MYWKAYFWGNRYNYLTKYWSSKFARSGQWLQMKHRFTQRQKCMRYKNKNQFICYIPWTRSFYKSLEMNLRQVPECWSYSSHSPVLENLQHSESMARYSICTIILVTSACLQKSKICLEDHTSYSITTLYRNVDFSEIWTLNFFYMHNSSSFNTFEGHV